MRNMAVANIPNIPGLSKQQLGELQKAAKKEMRIPPRIALIGECGVGKTTTINSMFNAGLETSHVKACTQESQELHIPVSEMSGEKGVIRIYDMPGLGEDMDADEKHKLTYTRVLSNCDVAVWVLDATTRHFTQTQLALRDVVGAAMGDLDRLVIGINKIDEIRPGQWNARYNLPSPEQEASIDEKIDDVVEKISKVCQLQRDRIIPYSAEKWYRLPDLLGAMLDACPKERAWVLFERANLADFLQKISPEILEDLK
jgi:uncharacterized protein